jgi:hypothetical protein
MKTEEKVGLVVTGAVIVGGVALLIANAKKNTPPAGLNAGAMVAGALDKAGNSYKPGDSGTLTATLTNTSVYQGTTTKVPYTFILDVTIFADTLALINDTRQLNLAAGQVFSLVKADNSPYTFTIPMDKGGKNLSASVSLFDTSGTNILASTPFMGGTIQSLVIVPGATIVW